MLRAFWPKSMGSKRERERTETRVRPAARWTFTVTSSLNGRTGSRWVAVTALPAGPWPEPSQLQPGSLAMASLTARATSASLAAYSRTLRSGYSGVRPVSTSARRGQATSAIAAPTTSSRSRSFFKRASSCEVQEPLRPAQARHDLAGQRGNRQVRDLLGSRPAQAFGVAARRPQQPRTVRFHADAAERDGVP